MSGQEWIELLNLIPEDQHSQLNVMCRSGVELSIDALMRTERSFLVYRGRVVGTTDEGRVFFTPYSEITSIYLNRFVKEDEVNNMFEPSLEAMVQPLNPPEAGEQFTPTPAPAIPPPAPQPLVFPSIGLNGSGLLPRAGGAATAPQKTEQVPKIAAIQAPPAPKAPSFLPPPPSMAAQDAANKGSILERLRAQRTGPTRKSGN